MAHMNAALMLRQKFQWPEVLSRKVMLLGPYIFQSVAQVRLSEMMLHAQSKHSSAGIDIKV